MHQDLHFLEQENAQREPASQREKLIKKLFCFVSEGCDFGIHIQMYFVLLFFVVCCVKAQDPAPSWLAYAKTHCSGQVTRVSATTIVPAKPKNGGAYTSWWFGIGNLNQKEKKRKEKNQTSLTRGLDQHQSHSTDHSCLGSVWRFKQLLRFQRAVPMEWKCKLGRETSWCPTRRQVSFKEQKDSFLCSLLEKRIFAAVQLLSNGTYEMTIRVRGSINTTITELRPPSVLEGAHIGESLFFVLLLACFFLCSFALSERSFSQGMNFTNVYFVVEHHSACNTFPPSNAMIYSNIQVFCNGNYGSHRN